MEQESEKNLLELPLVSVYKVPPNPIEENYSSVDWNKEQPDWSGRLRLVAKGNCCVVKLEDKMSGDLFAQGSIDEYPGRAVTKISDCPNCFILRIQDGDGRNEFIGCKFKDHNQVFDFQDLLGDFFKKVRKQKKLAQKQGASNLPPSSGGKSGWVQF